MQDVVALRHLGGHRLWLRFDDGVEGVVDFKRVLKFRGVVAALRDPSYFAQAFIHPEAGVVTWPNGADVDTLLLYSKVTGVSIRSLFAADSGSASRRLTPKPRASSRRRPKSSTRLAGRARSPR